MSLTDKLLAVPRFIENEFESFVNSAYALYQRKTGGSQFGLSNYLTAGGFVYAVAPDVFINGLTISVLSSTAGMAMCIGYIYKKNAESERLESDMQKSGESIKHPKIEDWKSNMKIFGRISLTFLAYKGAEVATWYFTSERESYLDVLRGNFNILSDLLCAWGAYTAAIDTNNPKKSRITEFVRNLAPVRIPQLRKIPVEESHMDDLILSA